MTLITNIIVWYMYMQVHVALSLQAFLSPCPSSCSYGLQNSLCKNQLSHALLNHNLSQSPIFIYILFPRTTGYKLDYDTVECSSFLILPMLFVMSHWVLSRVKSSLAFLLQICLWASCEYGCVQSLNDPNFETEYCGFDQPGLTFPL